MNEIHNLKGLFYLVVMCGDSQFKRVNLILFALFGSFDASAIIDSLFLVEERPGINLGHNR